jgi:hypothetical protein
MCVCHDSSSSSVRCLQQPLVCSGSNDGKINIHSIATHSLVSSFVAHQQGVTDFDVYGGMQYLLIGHDTDNRCTACICTLCKPVPKAKTFC